MPYIPNAYTLSNRLSLCCAALLGLFTLAPGMSLADTLSETQDRGLVRCGVNPDLTGFSRQNSLGDFTGFDVDFCRAVSSAIFGSPDRVQYIPVSAPDRLAFLAEGRFEILSRNTTWTLERNVDFGQHVGVTFYDGQGFMVPKTTGIRAADFFSESELRYKPVYFDDEILAALAYADGECFALTTDRSALAAQRTSFKEPDAHQILPEVISKEPLGPIVRNDDVAWENINRWTLACLINAEEHGITQNNVLSSSTTDSPPAVQRLLGVAGSAGEKLGLEANWCANVIAALGNYSEIYERHVGISTPVGLDRGINSLWTNGGLLYAPPIR